MQLPVAHGDGGLGFRNLVKKNIAFWMKLRFQLIPELSKLWVKVLRAKYKWQGIVPSSLHARNSSRLWVGFD
ncbi:hypothetical protein GQ457_01G015400 [Hibiscus cannabinus]